MLQTEWDWLMIKRTDLDPIESIDVFSQPYAEQLFLDTYKFLTK